MSSAPIFPPEIEEIIIDVLADDKDRKSLKACSLVCQAYLSSCRKHLFAHIVLNRVVKETSEDGEYDETGEDSGYDKTSGMAMAVFEELLSASPAIGDYVRKLDYNVTCVCDFRRTFQDSLKHISKLESLSVSYQKSAVCPQILHLALGAISPGRIIDWSNYPVMCPRELDWSNNSIPPVLLHLLHLPTLTDFSVFSVKNFVLEDLVPCVNLKRLDIGRGTTVINSVVLPIETLPAQPAQLHELRFEAATAAQLVELWTARRPDGKPIVDLGALVKIKIEFDRRRENHVAQKLFQNCDKLTDVDLSFRSPRDVRPTVASMLRPSMRTLKRLAVKIEVNFDDYFEGPLFGIPAELEDMRAANIIESLEFNVFVQTDVTYSTGDAWGRLDEVLSKTGWSALKRVSLTIGVATYSRMPEDNLEEELRKLPETQLLRLSASESIAFDFKFTAIQI